MAGKSWPDTFLVPSDTLIKSVPGREHLNACIGRQHDQLSGLSWYVDGFRSAGRRLVDEFILKGQSADYPLDTVVYPIAFVYRHHFELLLKLIIREINLLNRGKAEFPMGHKLLSLWSVCRPLVENAVSNAVWSQNQIVESLFRELDTVDPDGQAARYPHGRDGSQSFGTKSILNVESFAETADRLSDYLNSILTAIESLRP